MNARAICNYWYSKYEDHFHKPYECKNYFAELALLKRLLKNYNFYLILDAIDMFFGSSQKKDFASIFFFAGKNFNSKFQFLIQEKDIIPFQRMILWYKLEDQTKIKSLIQRYKNYCHALSLSNEELLDMVEIVKKLESIQVESRK